MNLSLTKIRKFKPTEVVSKPDYDDTQIEFTFSNGVSLVGLTQCNNRSCKTDSLEGFGGFLIIETVEELNKILDMTYEEVLDYIYSLDQNFNKIDYI